MKTVEEMEALLRDVYYKLFGEGSGSKSRERVRKFPTKSDWFTFTQCPMCGGGPIEVEEQLPDPKQPWKRITRKFYGGPFLRRRIEGRDEIICLRCGWKYRLE